MSSGIVPGAEGAHGGRWKRYPAYKDSGVEWLGAVPDGWDVIPLRWNSRCPSGDGISSENIETLDDEKNVVPVIGGNGVMGYTSKGNIDYPVLAIGRVGALCGNVHVVQPPAWITDNALMFDADAGAFDLIFLAEVLRSRNLNEIASKTAQPLITGTQVRDQRVPHPTIEEQCIIATFLDRETGCIDALVAKKERQIGLLQEKRTALISHAVTKGLDPDAPMKDSGVEWLGAVPVGWDVKRLKQVVSRIGSGKTPKGGAEVYSESGIVFLRSQNIHFDGMQLDDVVYIDESIDTEMASTRVLPNDILLNITGASLGRCTIVPEDFAPANVNQHVCIIRPTKAQIDPQFLHNTMASNVLQAQIFSCENGTSREGLTFSQISTFVLTVPKQLAAQRTIAAFLDRETGRIDALTTKVRESTSQLREYRTALVSAAVTGKIDVRGELVP